MSQAAPSPSLPPTLTGQCLDQATCPQTTATVRYCRPAAGAGSPLLYVGPLPPGVTKQSNLETSDTTVKATDLRGVPADDFSVKRNGFQLVSFKVPADINWEDAEEVQARYLPLVQQLLQRVTGASRVYVFDKLIRRGHAKLKAEEEGSVPALAPVFFTHADFTLKSGTERLSAILPEEADRLRQAPFGVYQVWRPLVGPVLSSPLGLIDVASVAKEDLTQCALHFPDRIGHNYIVAQNPRHRWYYTSRMEPDEAYVFVSYDSRTDGRAGHTPHSGIVDHATPADAPQRESIETRAYCFWEDG